jgi:hypothetical protein
VVAIFAKIIEQVRVAWFFQVVIRVEEVDVVGTKRIRAHSHRDPLIASVGHGSEAACKGSPAGHSRRRDKFRKEPVSAVVMIIKARRISAATPSPGRELCIHLKPYVEIGAVI